MKPTLTLGAILTLSTLSVAHSAQLDLRVIETTDLHANMMDYNYYQDKPVEDLGLVRASSLVKQAQGEVKNSVLVDNGDLIQGSPMGDYIASKGLKKGDIHAVYKAMNLLPYQVGNIGNHEFNYGLTFLKNAIAGAKFPYISANVYDAKTGKHYFTPYLIKTYQFVDKAGKKHPIKVGYIGFVPPQIMIWDKQNLDGKVTVADIKETAEKLIPEMKAKGADVIIAIPHSGLSTEPYKALAENSVYYLSQVKGIDGIAFGHSHAVFPSADFANLPNVDIATGKVNGVVSMMPGRWGSHVGVMDLVLSNDSGKWQVIDGKASVRSIYDKKTKQSFAKADEDLRQALKEDHIGTRNYVNQPIGHSDAPMYSFLALVQDDPTIQIVNLAQKDYVEKMIQGDPNVAHLPVLSAAAPFKSGGRKNDPENYTLVEKGQLTFRNAADLYLYPNTLVALKLNGAEIKEYLECSAGQFNQIDPNSDKPQGLINWDGFRSYNFDTIDGVNYVIDITQPARYDGNCKLINPNAQRISQLSYQGKAVSDKQEFILATNNYRAFGGKFAGTDKAHLVFSSPDENRTILADYIRRVSKEQGQIKPSADNNWHFKLIPNPNLQVYFETSPSEKAEKFIQQKGLYPMQKGKLNDTGFAIYRIDLSQMK